MLIRVIVHAGRQPLSASCSLSTLLSCAARRSYRSPRPFLTTRHNFLDARRYQHDASRGVRHTPTTASLSHSNTSQVVATPISDARYHVFERGVGGSTPLAQLDVSGHAALGHNGILERLALVELLANTQQEDGIDPLCQCALNEGDWEKTKQIVYAVAEQFRDDQASRMRVEDGLDTGRPMSLTLDDFASAPMLLEQVPRSNGLRLSLEELTRTSPYRLNTDIDPSRKAMGQVWQSLGRMILAAADEEGQKSTIMPHVLQMLAHLHHLGIIPDSIYRYKQSQDDCAFQQPPTLHLLSSRLLTALSDAMWKTHPTLVPGVPNEDGVPHRLFGYAIPGSRYRASVDTIGHEVWLEFVLWSCLHGEWINDGMRVLQDVLRSNNGKKWSLICFRDLIRGAESMAEKDISSFSRDSAEKTLSSELVSAYADAVLSVLGLGVGTRGIPPSDVLNYLETCKKLLDRNNLGLGGVSWDAAVLRFVESGAIDIEADPAFTLSLLELVQPFGKELVAVNAPSEALQVSRQPSYVLDPSAASLGLYHRIIRAYTTKGDVGGALKAFQQMLKYTDKNKQASLADFCKTLERAKRHPSRERLENQQYDSGVIDFPAYFPHLPAPLLADLMELLNQSGADEMARWLLYSEELDGPLLPKEMYSDPVLGPDLVRFGTKSRDQQLLADVLQRQIGQREGDGNVSRPVLVAFVQGQIENRRWQSVRNMLEHVKERGDSQHRHQVAAVLAKEALVIHGQRAADPGALHLLRDLLQGTFGHPAQASEVHRMSTILGVLASIDDKWAAFCLPLGPTDKSVPTILGKVAFNLLLEGVLAAYGPIKAQRIFDLWTRQLTRRRQADIPGGVARMGNLRPSRALSYESPLEDIILSTPSGESTLRFRGRLQASIEGLRLIVKASSAREPVGLDEERATMHAWVRERFRSLGMKETAIDAELKYFEGETTKTPSSST